LSEALQFNNQVIFTSFASGLPETVITGDDPGWISGKNWTTDYGSFVKSDWL